MIEFIEETTQNSIIEAMGRMYENTGKDYYPTTTLVVSREKFNEIRKLPGYSSDTLFGKKVIDGECGKIEGLVVVVSDMLIADLELDI